MLTLAQTYTIVPMQNESLQRQIVISLWNLWQIYPLITHLISDYNSELPLKCEKAFQKDSPPLIVFLEDSLKELLMEGPCVT